MRWLHHAGGQTHAFPAQAVQAKADPITSVCEREFNPVYLLSVPLAPFCDDCVEVTGRGPDEGYS